VKWVSLPALSSIRLASCANKYMRNCRWLLLWRMQKKKSRLCFVRFNLVDQGWAMGIRSFWNWAIVFFWAKNERFGKLLIYRSFSLFLKERSLFLSLFWKEQKKSDRSFALLQRATKRAIAHSLFSKEQMSERSLNRSIEKSENERWANERLPNPVGDGLQRRGS